MMDQVQPRPARFAKLWSILQGRPAAITLLALFGLGYTLFLTAHGASFASGSDSSGYFNSARLIGEGRATDTVRRIDGLAPPGWDYYFQQPLGFRAIGNEGIMAPTYPIGLPLMLLAASTVAGWDHAAIVVNVLCALGCGWLVLLIGREFCGLRGPWLLLSLSLVWLSPLFAFFSVQPMSDMPATFWVLLVLHAAAASRRDARWALVAGAAAGIAVLVRPTNVLLAVPIVILLGLNWRAWLGFIGAGLPFAAVQLYYNHHLYGDALASGYGDVSSLFKTKYALPNLAHFAHWIPQLLTPLVVLALGLPWFFRQRPRIAAALGLWAATLIGFYAFYYHSGETWWYLRFILPAFPCLVLLAVMTAQRLCDLWPSGAGRAAVAVGLVALTAFLQTGLSRKLYVTEVKPAETAYVHVTRWLEANVPPDAIIAAMQMSGALHFYTEFPLLRYDLMPREQFARAVAVARENGRAIYAPLFPFELERVVEPKLGGEWEKVATVDYITIWRLKF